MKLKASFFAILEFALYFNSSQVLIKCSSISQSGSYTI